LQLNDTQHSIALGTAIGMFIGMTPTVGIQMILVIVFNFMVGWLFRFNRIAALLTVYISNPLTVLPIYWFNYQVGIYFVDGNLSKEDFTANLTVGGLSESWNSAYQLIVEVGEPLIIGSLVVATVLGVVTYPAMRFFLKRFQEPSSTLFSSVQTNQEPTNAVDDKP
jgi:hypothetical protein